MNYSYAIEKHDINKIDKLNKLVDLATYWDDVRKLTKNVKTDHTIKRWQCLADVRFKEIQQEYKDRYFKYRDYLLTCLDRNTMELVDAWIYGTGELPTNRMDSDAISKAHTLKMVYTQCKIFGIL